MLAAPSRAETLFPLHLLTSAWWRWRAWAGKGALSVADEVLISGSNFMVSVMLGRWLSSAQYGAYALSFSIFLLLTSIHQALLLEPMSVFGPSLYPDLQREYL